MVYVDEAQDYFDQNITTILSQARKYRVGMVMAHQYLGQLTSGLQEAFEANTSIKLAGVHQHVAQVDAAVFEAILGNAGSLMVFRVGANGGPLFVRQLESVTLGDLINLPNHRAYVRLMVDGERTRTFSAETLPLASLSA